MAIKKIISQAPKSLDFTSLFNHPKFLSGYISKCDYKFNKKERRMEELQNTLT